MDSFHPQVSPQAKVRPYQKRKTISSAYINRIQRNHFLLYTIGPFVGTILAFISLSWLTFGPIELGITLLMCGVTSMGITVGFHRYFTHRSFKTNRVMQVLFIIIGSMVAQGPVVSWVVMHRRHHECSDAPEDPHSPNHHGKGLINRVKGLWHAQVQWLMDYEYANPAYYAPELMKDQTLAKLSRYYHVWVSLGLLLPAILGGVLNLTWQGAVQGFLWGGVFRIFITQHLTGSVNSLSHVYGQRSFETDDHSHNIFWLAIPTGGETWHNNHHAFPSSAIFGLEWWQVDLGGYFIRVLEKLGLAWDVKMPTKAMLSQKKMPQKV
ncbi:acyl-CoA desaturase [Adonisia turfae]|uniref:Acyl-CoA desaturase n=1 Tax=Adonisia turfae CCMR0081 TaxID=2292702 RepID=A0A6M0RQC5_9CYAN|nr:fatty acid desaturase [Adonisia turfae]NEZ58468.1 acyl-CoA desaturase [Adonisia turfae CCMR0081]